jgi:hypothetical protein
MQKQLLPIYDINHRHESMHGLQIIYKQFDFSNFPNASKFNQLNNDTTVTVYYDDNNSLAGNKIIVAHFKEQYYSRIVNKN